MKTISSIIKKVAGIANSKSSRPILNSVLITEDKYVATDAYKIIEVERKYFNEEDVEFFPSKDKFKELPKKGVVISAEFIKKLKFKKSKVLPVLSNIALLFKKKENKVEFIKTDLEVEERKNIRIIEGEYPDYKIAFPKEEPKFEISVDARLLQELLEVFKYGVDEQNTVSIEFYDKQKPLVIRKKGMIGSMMPLKF